MVVHPDHRYSNESERDNQDIYDLKLKKPFGLHGLYKIIQRCKGWTYAGDFVNPANIWHLMFFCDHTWESWFQNKISRKFSNHLQVQITNHKKLDPLSF